MQQSLEAAEDEISQSSVAAAIANEKRVLQCLYSYFTLKDGWIWGSTAKAFWVYTVFEWQPLDIVLDAKLIYWMRYSSNRAGGRSNIFFSSKPMAHFLARCCRTLRSLHYEKSYATDDSWRRRVLATEMIPDTDDIREEEALRSQSDLLRDSHLSFADLAIILLASCQSLEVLTLSVNWDPGAPSSLWLGLPPIRDCEWYILCPKSFPPLKVEETRTYNLPLFDYDNRVPGPQPCRAGIASVNDMSGGLRSATYNDEHDHIKCCVELDRSINWTGQAMRSPLRIMYGDGKAALSTIANPSTRPLLSFSKLKHLTLQPPSGAIYTRSCWALLCLLRGLKLTSFPQLESLALLGDFVIFRQQKAEQITSLEEWERLESQKSKFQQSFEDTELWVRDMVNLYLCGEVPIRDVPNFSARRFTTFANRWAFVHQQRYWRAILEQSNVWNFPNLKKISLSGTATAGSDTWQKLVLRNMMPSVTKIEVLELDRTIRSPVEALSLPYDAHAVNATRFPVLQNIIVRCVYGVETLAVVQRLFSVLLDRPVLAYARELVLTDHHRIALEASRLTAWPTYQLLRTAKNAHIFPRSSRSSLSAKPQSIHSFFVPDAGRKLRFRFLFGGEDYDPDEVEDKLMELAGAGTIAERRSLTMKERDSNKSTMEDLDALAEMELDETTSTDYTYFYDIDEVHFDIGTYEDASKSAGLFDIASDRLMQLRFVNGSYSHRHRGKVAEFIPAVAEGEDESEDEGSGSSDTSESGTEERCTPVTVPGRLGPKLQSFFRAGSNDSQVLGHAGALHLPQGDVILKDIPDVGLLAQNQPTPRDAFSRRIVIEQRKRLSAPFLFEGAPDDHRKLLGVTPYHWPKEEPEVTETTLSNLKITLRYGMAVSDRDSPQFGPRNPEAYRRVMLARKWIAFNPTLKGCPHKLLELKTSPERSLDET